MARPSKFTKTTASLICERLMSGESLRRICADDGMPTQSTVYRWLDQIESFREQYARAREIQADTLVDEIIDIADDGLNDTYTDDDGNERTNHDVIARSRLRVDSRKWIASKLKPKKYGDKLELAGGLDVRSQTDEQLDNRLAELLGKAGVATTADREGAPPPTESAV